MEDRSGIAGFLKSARTAKEPINKPATRTCVRDALDGFLSGAEDS
jgi:hypothetical protein